MKWCRIATFYLVAIAVSALARLYWHSSVPTTGGRGAFGMYLHLVAGVGPAIGAAAVWVVYRYRSRMSLGGTNPALGFGMAAVPALVMAALGIPNPYGVEAHLFGLHMGIWIAAYATLEEIGWRGYLQDELGNRRAILKYSIVGLFWYAWHLSWLAGHPLNSEVTTILFMILASIGIGFVADRTGSVLAASSFHVIGNILGLTTDFVTMIPSMQIRATIVVACLVPWLIILRVWRVRDQKLGTIYDPGALSH